MKTEDVNQLWSSEKEFEQVYNRYASVLTAYALKFVSRQTAQDVVQDLFLDIWNHPPALKTSLKSYLFAAVRNACLDHLKSMQVREKYVNQRLMQLQTDEIMYYQENDVSIIEEEQFKLIHAAIGELPEKCREVFELCYYRNMKSSEIAEHLQLSVRTVQNHLYKGLIKLRSIIAQKTSNGLILFVWIMRKFNLKESFQLSTLSPCAHP
jgi:RNA polymerase sigma-70 factor (ECF subfamily)